MKNYNLEIEKGELVYTWQGGEYVDVAYNGRNPHDVINVRDLGEEGSVTNLNIDPKDVRVRIEEHYREHVRDGGE